MKEPVTIAQIERATQKYADAHYELSVLVDELNVEIAAFNAKITAAREKRLPAIRAAVKLNAARKTELAELISDAPALFKDPRTAEFHGVTVGMRWSNGGLEIADENKTIALIEEHFAAMAKILIKTKKTPVKTTIKALPPEDLAKIDVRLVGAGDHVVIKPVVDNEIEEIVAKLLEEPKK